MILKSLKRLFNNGTKKGFTMIALKSLKRFLNDGTKNIQQ